MTMMTRKWKRAGSGLIAGAAATLLIGASVGSAAAAAPTWSVRPGGVATAKAVGKTLLKDTKTGTLLTCASSSARFVLKKGHHLSGNALGLITAIGFAGCTGPLGLKFSVKSTHLPWHLNAVSYNKKTQVTTGTVTGIHATLSGSGCTAVVDGTSPTKNNGMVKAVYSNKTHKLTVLLTGGNLHIYKVSAGCLGLINSGDGTSFTSVNLLHPAQIVTSP